MFVQKTNTVFAPCEGCSHITSHMFESTIECKSVCLCVVLQDLQKREDIVTKKEAMLAERSELEIKKLRSSQVLNKVF